MFDTIVAVATPLMKSALAIIRVSGNDCFEIVSKICKKDLTSINKREIVYGHIYDGEEVIDEVVMNVYVGPKSFTGENLIEIMCHGSVLICDEIVALLIKYGARYAAGGEFSSRAFLHNRIDLIQAEAINDVINATTKEAKKLSLMSLDGKTSATLLPIKTKIADLLSQIEVNIDYPEYLDIEEVTYLKVEEVVDELHKSILKLIDDGKKGKIIKDGLNVVICGKPNVGKSSLLNSLLQEDKAIVTSIPGTTRDIVEGDINLGGIALHLVDTAGLHETDDFIESIGIDKSKEAINKAELALIVLDASKELDNYDKEILDFTKDMNRIIIYNKIDLIENKKYDDQYVYISALNNDVSSLKDKIIKMFGITQETYNTPSLNNARQIGLLYSCDECLRKAKEDALNGLPIDLVSVSLQNAYGLILDCLGESHDHDLTKEIFSRFCVGK